jgi:hypothetical protein
LKAPVFREMARQTIDLSQYKYRPAKEEDYTTLIDEPVVITTNGRPTVVYLELDDDCTDIVYALQHIRYSKDERAKGMITRSAYIGYHPRITTRRDYCTATEAHSLWPDMHNIISSYAKKVSTYYQQFNPEVYEMHQQLTDKVLPDWHMDETIFTSGIVNKDNPLMYHHDTGNFTNVWSNMLAFKKDIKGGYLAIPEYDIGLYIRNNSLLMFDGQNILHGVTAFTKLTRQAYRYSIVYYSLQRMWDCLTPGEELERITRIRTEREHRRAARDISGQLYSPKETHHSSKKKSQGNVL